MLAYFWGVLVPTGVMLGISVVSILLESMVMVLDCPCLASESQLIQNLLNKPLTKFGTSGTSENHLGNLETNSFFSGCTGSHLA